MDQKEILSRVEHTLLTPTATWEQVKAVCDEGRELEPPPCVFRPGM